MSSQSRWSSFSSLNDMLPSIQHNNSVAETSINSLRPRQAGWSRTSVTPPSLGSRKPKALTSFPAKKKTTKRTANVKSLWLQSISCWKWELLSCVGALGLIVAMFTLLLRYDGKTIPDWPKKLNLNSILAIFSTTFKAMMLLITTECLNQLKWLWFAKPQSLKDFDTFDWSSRSIIGSSRLLVTVRGRHLAAIGACIVILAVAIDPFSQQAIQYYNCWTLDDQGSASIPIYRSGSYDPSGGGISRTSMQLTGALYDGLLSFGGPAGEAVQPTCPSGLCNFTANYSSLGFCSSCRNAVYDLTSALIPASEGSDVEAIGGLSFNHTALQLSCEFSDEARIGEGGNTVFSMMTYNAMFAPESSIHGPYTAQTGLPFIYLDEDHRPMEAYSMTTNGAPLGYTLSIAPTIDPNCTTGWMRGQPRLHTDCLDPSLIASTMQDGHVKVNNNSDPKWQSKRVASHPNVTSSLCSLSYCTKTYNSTMRDGRLNETLLNEDSTIAVHGNPHQNMKGLIQRNMHFISSPCRVGNATYQIDDFLDLGKAVENEWLPPTADGDLEHFAPQGIAGDFPALRESLPAGSDNRSILDSCAIQMNYATDQSLRQIYASLVTGLGLITPSPLDGALWKVDDLKSSLNETYFIEWIQSSQISNFYNNGSPSLMVSEAVMDNVAQAMTRRLRSLDSNNSVAYGDLYANQTCVRVMWPWLLLPLILILTTCCFLTATLLRNNQCAWKDQDIKDTWKSNQLAVLLHGLSETTRRALGPLLSVNEMDKEAVDLKVQMGNQHEGWRLVLHPSQDPGASSSTPVPTRTISAP